MKPGIFHEIEDLRARLSDIRCAGRRIGVVPTMGALHEGHLSLVRASLERCDASVITIFVNPSQFGPNEDFERYPRTLPGDIELLESLHVKKPLFVFAPTTETMYPQGFDSWVDVGSISLPLEGCKRSGHFRGVATVVAKLFLITQADLAFFGQKDLQQSLVIRKMVADLNIPVEIVTCPIFREPDGLAMSSRNRYLSPNDRKEALVLYESLQKAKAMIESGERDAEIIRTKMERTITKAESAKIDYIAITDPANLESVTKIGKRTAILLAVKFGETRLIDNMLIEV